MTIGGTSVVWTKGASSGSGVGPYTFTVSRGAPNSDGTLTIQVAIGAVQDAAGNTSAASSTIPYAIDTDAPSLTLAPVTASPTGSASLTFTLTGDENLNCATISTTNGVDFTFSNISSIGPITGTATCTIPATSSIGSGATGTSTLTSSGGFSVSDTAGNAQTVVAGSPASVVVDRQGPTLTGGGHSTTPTNSTALSFTISGNENINCATLTSADFTLTAATFASSTQTSPSLCTIVVTSTIGSGATGTSTVALSGGFGATDTLGNTTTTASGFPMSWTVDRQIPSVTAFSCVPAAGLISATSLNCSVTFSESVTGFDATTADLTIGGASDTWTGGPSSPTSGTGPYTFTVSRGAPNSDGSLTLQIAAAAAQDAVGNLSTASSTLSYTVDTTPPVLTGSGQSTTPTGSTALSFTISGNENITCSTLAAGDFTLTNATFVSSTQTTPSLCTIALTSTIGSGSAGTSTAALSGTFGANDTAGNTATTASGFPMSWTVDRQGNS